MVQQKVRVYYAENEDAPYVEYTVETDVEVEAGDKVVLLLGDGDAQNPYLVGKLAATTISELEDQRGKKFQSVRYIDGIDPQADDEILLSFIGGDANKPLAIQNFDRERLTTITREDRGFTVRAYPPKDVDMEADDTALVDFAGGDANHGVVIFRGLPTKVSSCGLSINWDLGWGIWNPTGYPMQRKAFYDPATGRFWTWYAVDDGIDHYQAYASAPLSTLVFSGTYTKMEPLYGLWGTGKDGATLAAIPEYVNATTTYVHTAVIPGGIQTLGNEDYDPIYHWHVIYRRGLLASDGTITWDPKQSVGYNPYAKYPSITVDSTGHVWVAWTQGIWGVGQGGWVMAAKNANTDGTWSDALRKSYNHWLNCWHTGLAPLTNGKMYLLFSRGDYSNTMQLGGFYWNGSTWSSPEWPGPLYITYHSSWTLNNIDDKVFLATIIPAWPYQDAGIVWYKRNGSWSWGGYIHNMGMIDYYTWLPALGRRYKDLICVWLQGTAPTILTRYRRYRAGSWGPMTLLGTDDSAINESAYSNISEYDSDYMLAYCYQYNHDYGRLRCIKVTP